MNKKNFLIFESLFLVFFILIALNLDNKIVLQNDFYISDFVVQNQISWLTSFSSVLSVLFEPFYVAIFVLIFSIILWARKFRNEAVYFVFVFGYVGALIYLLKHFFSRARPVVQFLTETGYSFPSGHALISVVVFGSLIYFVLKLKSARIKTYLTLLSMLGIVILGLSRVCLNVHWFSDVIGGYFLGAMVLFAGIYLYEANIFRKLTNLFYPK